MLTRMRIVNIQKHKDLELLLDKINVIVGTTDSGKTSVLRALTWALTNDDAGENLINNQGAKSCCVEIDADGNVIKRSWSKGKNAYSLDDKEFTTFRTSVPSPIADLLRLDTINIQRRRDLPFMVYFKASDCANQFSEMMDLSEIDNIITNSNKSVKVHSDVVDQLKADKAEIDKSLTKYEQLDEAIEAFNALNKLRKNIKEAGIELCCGVIIGMGETIEAAKSDYLKQKVALNYLKTTVSEKELNDYINKINEKETDKIKLFCKKICIRSICRRLYFLL